MSVSQGVFYEKLDVAEHKEAGYFARFIDSLGEEGLVKWGKFLDEQAAHHKKTMQIRANELNAICGLYVTCVKDKQENLFTFSHHNKTVTAIYTYPKAKAFAEGVRFGQRCRDVMKD